MFKMLKNIIKKNQNVKIVIDFGNINSKSIKSIVVKKNSIVKVKTRFMNGKMMFPKVLLKRFLFDMTDVFCFPYLKV